MIKLTDDIKQWAMARDLHNADPAKQVLKLGEEFGELCEAMAKDRYADKLDAIGDMYVVLTILSMQLNSSIEECVQLAYNQIKNRKGQIINGVYVKEEDLPTRFEGSY